MRKPRTSMIKLSACLSIFCILLLSLPAHAQKPGAHYFADADGNGVIEVPDLIALNTVLGYFSADDTLLYSGYPQSRYRQDLDGNGVIEIPDLIILNSWVPGDFSNNPGIPDRIILDGDTHPNLIPGNSVTIAAYALSPIAAGSQVRTGFGIIFKIDPSSTCTTAQIRGYDVAGGATVNDWRSNSAYHYTLKPGAPDNGKASVRVNTNGCTGGQVIKIEVYIPDDIEAGVVPGRFPTKLSATQKFNVTVADVNPPDTFITANPPDPTNSQSAAFEFDCSTPPCTYECKLDLESWGSCTSQKTYTTTESWVATTTVNAPVARSYHRAVWTGSEMIIWGGNNGSNLNSGGRYNPVTDSWTATSNSNVPTAREFHTAVWTGSEMIVWGGNKSYLNSGGRYNPATDSWTGTTTTNAPDGRCDHTAVWTGAKMIIWGGEGSGGNLNTGGIYDPSNDTWIATSSFYPSRRRHSAVWTGDKMIIWGGLNSVPTDSGGVYNPASNSWTATSSTNNPGGRYDHNAVWTGSEMIVWGGWDGNAPFNTGGRYNPTLNNWTTMSTTNAPTVRHWQSSTGAVWTGTEMLVWSGSSWTGSNDGGRYNPSTDSWVAITLVNAPNYRYGTDIVWTGNKMLVWAGVNGSNTGGVYTPGGGDLTAGDHTFEVRAYDLAMNVDPTPAGYTWNIDLTPPDSTINSYPPSLSNAVNVDFTFSANETGCSFECKLDNGAWTPCSSPQSYYGLADGAHTFQVRATDVAGNLEYNPAFYSWTIDATPPETYIDTHPPNPTNSSSASFQFHSNETGSSFECNLDSSGWEPCTSPVSYGSLLAMSHTFQVRATDLATNTDPTPASFTWLIDQTPPDTTITSMPPDPDNHNYADFSFTCTKPPCTYDCRIDSGSWSSCTSPSHYVALSNGSHTFEVRGYDSLGNLDPTPASYTWTINLDLPDTYISSGPANPTTALDAVFDFYCSSPPCTYECKLDLGTWSSCTSPKSYTRSESWTATTTTNAPSARRYHHSIWTGTEMIVWGGYNGSYLNTGSRYNPVTDSWTAVATLDAPTGRIEFAAVWTGNQMIVWGGYAGSYQPYGGRYFPSTNCWIGMSATNQPSARREFSSVWTGSKMIVWGGYPGSRTNTGGIYDPANNSWIPTSTGSNVPSARYNHTAVWTGNEMVVWGGYDTTNVNTGGRYYPASDSWLATSTGANVPDARSQLASVWTGNEMIIWGGYAASTRLNSGGRYNPDTDSWVATSTVNAPSARYWVYEAIGAVWARNEMIVWGGDNASPYPNDGGRYNPLTDTWTATATTNAPAGRYGADIVWAGTKMIVWGGYNTGYLNSGGVYLPWGGYFIEGNHNFQARASDQYNNTDPTPASYDWTIDLTPPETTITSFPENPTSSYDATFDFSCNETGCTFECKLDSGAWSACSPPKNYFGLVNGSHTFQVRATDALGNMELTRAVYTWTVDSLPPDTFIDTHPPDPTNSSSAVFTFHCDKTGCTFECDLDFMGWEPCTSPTSYSSLLAMTHTFRVRATDLAANTDPTPASFTWTIDQTPPDTAITANPPDPDTHNFADFSFTCNKLPCTYECNLDASGWSSCPSPVHYVGLANGGHNFQVRATDSLGNLDPIPASYNWTVNANPPDTIITIQPDDPTNLNYAQFVFNCSSGPCTFECNLDNQGWASCSSPKNYSNLADGSHNFKVRAVDLQNNIDPTPASYTWTVDATPPNTIMTLRPYNPSRADVVFGFDCTGGPCTYECNLDSQGWENCSSPKNYAGLAEAQHTFQVRAYDWVQNVDPTPATYTWQVAFHDYWVQDTGLRKLPDPKSGHTAVWTGTVMMVWGGGANSGNIYDPGTDSWTAISTVNCPQAITGNSAVWTGEKMIVWGGYDGAYYLNTSGIYEPSTDSWVATSTAGAPPVRKDHTAVWTGTEMIVWGGYDGNSFINNGGRYNPVTDSWTATASNSLLGRSLHTAVWTGSEMIIWGGYCYYLQYLADGARYNPGTNSWTATSTINAPIGRALHTAVWTGSKMVIWGGIYSFNTKWGYNLVTNTGGMYDPAANSWTATSAGPEARYAHSAVWTGNKMVIWGGAYEQYAFMSVWVITLNSGGRFDPSTNSWNITSGGTNLPATRYYHTAVWTGTEMIVWGGSDSQKIFNNGGRYNPTANSWTAVTVPAIPAARAYHTVVWTGAEMVVWGGRTSSASVTNTGGRYNPATDSWNATFTTNAPEAREYHSAVWTGNNMIVWGGRAGDIDGLSNGGIYDPATDSWTAAITDLNAPSSRYEHTAIWTGTEMIVWGGHGYSPGHSPAQQNTGGRYDPLSDTWTPTSTGSNVPPARYRQTAVWTGSEMIVWGGQNDGGAPLSGGGRYDPLADSWVPTSDTNAPAARSYHTAVWTGTEMIVWGGYGGASSLNDGGRYEPVTDSWVATSTTGSPAGRSCHTAVWTETDMIVWGGYDGVGYLSTGGGYDPFSDSWSATSTINAPSTRANHGAVWTGSEMIIWGGFTGSYSSTGGRYVP